VKYGLDEKTIERIHAVLANYSEVDKAVLYGSRAKGNFKKGSDIDLTLYGGGLSMKTLRKIESDLDDLLLPYKLDLSLFEQIADPDVIDHIQRVGTLFFEKRVLKTGL
jgi:predicted nucleotidyltransferase